MPAKISIPIFFLVVVISSGIDAFSVSGTNKHLSAHSVQKRQTAEGGLLADISALVAEVRQDTGEARGILSKVEAYTAEIMQKVNSLEQHTQTEQVNGQVRLVNGGEIGGSFGRVEVLVEGEWGTVCDDGLFDGSDGYIHENGQNVASVICKSLGYNDGVPIFTIEDNRGTGKIAMDDLECNGDEASPLDCRFNNYDNCGHHEDFSVSCS